MQPIKLTFTKPLIYIFPASEGALIIPANRVEEIYGLKKGLEKINSWGDFKHLVPKGVYDLCFLMTYEYRSSFTYIAIPEERKNDTTYNHFIDENLSFSCNLGYYLGALHKFDLFGVSAQEWLPNHLKEAFGPWLRPLDFSRDCYIMADPKRIEELCFTLKDHGFDFVYPTNKDYFVLFTLIPKDKGNWYTDYDNLYTWVYKINSLSTDIKLSKNMIQKYHLELEDVQYQKFYQLEESDKFSDLCAELCTNGFLVLDWGFGINANEIIKAENEINWEERANLFIVGYKVEYRDVPLVYHSRNYYWNTVPGIFRSLLSLDINTINRTVDPSTHQSLRRFWDNEYIYNSLLTDFRQHGVFAIKFFYLKHRSFITRKLIEEPVNNSLLELIVSYNQKFSELSTQVADREGRSYSLSDATFIITEYLINEYIREILADQSNVSQFKDWVVYAESYKRCFFCGEQFSLINIPEWLYCGSNGENECCFYCPIVEFPNKNEILQRIQEFVNLCTFIPNSDAGMSNFSFMSRISAEKRKETIISFARMGRTKHVTKLFGSWFEGLYLADALPGGVIVTKRGIKCKANDGHNCDSLAEQLIDNWLSDHSIVHEREPYYPDHPELNQSGLKQADWLVGKTYIEYFGLSGDEKYDKKTESKLMLARMMDINLIPIYPSDITNLEYILKEINDG